MKLDRMRELRKEQHLSFDDIGEKIGISGVAIGRYERGERQPSLETISAIADMLCVSVDYLLERTNMRTFHPSENEIMNAVAVADEVQKTQAHEVDDAKLDRIISEKVEEAVRKALSGATINLD